MEEKNNITVQREYQDSLFHRLYTNKDALLELYRMLYPDECNINEDDIEIITLTNNLVVKQYNDVAFQVGKKLIILVEHQSSISENMPLRMLLYIAEEYLRVIKALNVKIYRKNLIKIPCPEFYVVYTGTEEWETDILRLSDAFLDSDNYNQSLELCVKIISDAKKDTVLEGYLSFISVLKGGMENNMISESMIQDFIDNYEGSPIFKKFLEDLGTKEVADMMNMENSYEIELIARTEEAREEGLEEGREEGREGGILSSIKNLISNLGLSEEQAINAVGVPEDEKSKYLKMLAR